MEGRVLGLKSVRGKCLGLGERSLEGGCLEKLEGRCLKSEAPVRPPVCASKGGRLDAGAGESLNGG